MAKKLNKLRRVGENNNNSLIYCKLRTNKTVNYREWNVTKLQRWKLIKRSNEILKSILNNHVDVEIDSDSDGEYEATDFNSELHIEDSADSDGEEADWCFFVLRLNYVFRY